MAAIALAGCGSSQSPAQRSVASAQAALEQVHSFHIDGTTVQSGQAAAVSGDIQIPGRMRVTVQQGASRAQITVIGPSVYLNANPAYLHAQGTPAAAVQRLANRWIELPAGSQAGIGTLLAATEPTTVGHCIVGPHFGTLTVQGRGVLNGRRVTIVASKGDVPGSTPSLLYLAANGPPLPLRIVQTGPQAPGGKPDPACHETKSDLDGTTTHDVVDFSQYNAAAPVTAPPSAVALTALLGAPSV